MDPVLVCRYLQDLGYDPDQQILKTGSLHMRGNFLKARLHAAFLERGYMLQPFFYCSCAPPLVLDQSLIDRSL